MKIRELRVVSNDRTLGTVGWDSGPVYLGAAEETFAQMRARSGNDDAFTQQLLENGWSNGYVYLGPAEEK